MGDPDGVLEHDHLLLRHPIRVSWTSSHLGASSSSLENWRKDSFAHFGLFLFYFIL